MATAEDLLGPRPDATAAPATAEQLLGPRPQTDTLQSDASPAQDAAFAQTKAGSVLGAFGYGAAQSWGANPPGLSDDDVAKARGAGWFNQYSDDRASYIKAFGEAALRGAAWTLGAVAEAPQAVIAGAVAARKQSAINDALANGYSPDQAADIGRSVENIWGSIGEGLPAVLGMHGVPEVVGAARDVGVIGKGQEGWLGKEEPLPPADVQAPAASAEAAARAATAEAEPVPPATPAETAPVEPSAEQVAPAEQPAPESVAAEQPAAPEAEAEAEPEPAPTMAADMGPSETAYGPEPSPDLAGNIRLDLLNTPDDVDAVIRQTADENNDFLDQRRGVVSDGQVLDLADALGMDASQLNARQIGQAFNAEQITAARQLLIESATSVRDAMAKAAEGSDADVLAYAEAKARHQMIQGQVSGITAEAGRALRAFRDLNGSADADALGDFLGRTTGKTIGDLREEAKLGSTLDTAEKVSKFVADTADPSLRDVLQYVYLNGLISGPITHMTYSAGNFLQALWHAVPEKGVAAGLGAIRTILNPEADRVYAGEVRASLYGMLKGARDGIPAAIKAWKANVAMPLPGEDAMPARPVPIKGKLGTVIGLPGRGVAAIHSFFRSIAYEQKIQELAYRNAAARGLAGNDFAGALADFVKSPSADAMREARDFANAQVYMKRPDFGTAMWHAEKFVDKHLWSKMLVPFMRIGSNMIEQAYVERSPIGLATRDVRGRFLGKAGSIAADEQRAKILVGVTLGLGIMSYAAEDRVTGAGPSGPDRATWLMTHQPYSARIGGVWVPYKRLGALGMLIGGYANLYSAAHQLDTDGLEKAGLALIKGTASNVLDETWMSGLSDFMNAMERPEQATGYVGRLLAGFIPYSSALRQTAAWSDPYEREARTVPQLIQNTIPGLSERLAPRRDVWGDPIPRPQDLFSALGSVASGQQRITDSPLDRELQRLGVPPAPMRPEARGVPLTDQQADDMQRVGGRFAKMRVGAILSIPGYAAIPDWAKRQMIVEAIENSHEAARALTMMQNPSILTTAVQSKLSRLRGSSAALPSVGVGAAR